jgi:hypothetical protein
MKRLAAAALAAATSILVAGAAFAETTTETTTTTSSGTVSDFGPDTIVIRSEASPDPIPYTYSKTTTYVDENGDPVSMETVKSGLPVTVHYTKTDDGMAASKVIVRKQTKTHTSPSGSTVEEKRTTITTP